MTRYRAGLASAPISDFMVMYNKHTLSLEDLSTLEEQNWLNDQVRKNCSKQKVPGTMKPEELEVPVVLFYFSTVFEELDR